MPKCVFVNETFESDGDQPPRYPWSKTVIYEMHVRGFTIHPESGVDHPRTYRGLMEKIAKAGIDIDALAAQFQDEGARGFVKSWKELMDCIASKSKALK